MMRYKLDNVPTVELLTREGDKEYDGSWHFYAMVPSRQRGYCLFFPGGSEQVRSKRQPFRETLTQKIALEVGRHDDLFATIVRMGARAKSAGRTITSQLSPSATLFMSGSSSKPIVREREGEPISRWGRGAVRFAATVVPPVIHPTTSIPNHLLDYRSVAAFVFQVEARLIREVEVIADPDLVAFMIVRRSQR
jgi:hypothetical protein